MKKRQKNLKSKCKRAKVKREVKIGKVKRAGKKSKLTENKNHN